MQSGSFPATKREVVKNIVQYWRLKQVIQKIIEQNTVHFWHVFWALRKYVV